LNIEYYGIKPSQRLYILILGLSTILAIDIVVDNKLSQSTILLTLIFIGLLIGSRSIVSFSKHFIERLIVKREFLDPLVENRDLRVRLTIVNNTRFFFPRIEIMDKYPGVFKLVRGSHVLKTILLPRSSLSYIYVVRTIIGYHVFGPLEIIVSDPFKLFNYKVEVNTGESTVCIKPNPKPISSRLIRLWTQSGLGLGKTRIKGFGQEFFYLREYVAGDEYRFIDWKSYARTGKLYIKLFEREANLSIVFVIDATKNSLRSIIGETPYEYMARVVAGLSSVLLNRGDWINVIVRSTTNLRSGYGRGRRHYYRILDTLSKVAWNPQESNISIGDLLLIEACRIPRRTKTMFLVLITSIDDYELKKLIDAYNKLKSIGHIVYIIQLLPELFEMKILRGLDAGLYYGLISNEIDKSRLIRKELLKHGLNSITTGPHDLLESIYLLIEKHRLVSS